MTHKIKKLTFWALVVAIFMVVQFQLVDCRAPSFLSTRSAKLSKKGQSCHQCSCIPGIPGAHGIPGSPGSVGAPGKDGLNGAKGDAGMRGPVGPQGFKGDSGTPGQSGYPGKPGKSGFPGKTGPRGKNGFPGRVGPVGLPGIPGPVGVKGEKGEPGSNSYFFNWHHCVWNRNDRIWPRKSGTHVQGCNYTKRYQNTVLKVSFQGNLGGNGCLRWYFKFNDQECTGPASIEAAVHKAKTVGFDTNHHFFQGICTNLPAGSMNVAMWVQGCHGDSGGNPAYCGNKSHSSILIEEISAMP